MNIKTVIIILILILSNNTLFAQVALINEVSSVNHELILDEEGDDSDWIELFNNSDTTIDLSGYYITDNRDKLEKWEFPSVTIQAEKYMLLFASGKDRYNSARYWEAIINQGDSWNYLLPQSEPSSSWKLLDFDDSNWNEGNSGIGYGDNDDETIIPSTVSLFARKIFTIEDTSIVDKIFFHIDYDDGFAAYLNGVEFARANLGYVGSTIRYDQTADGNHEAQIYGGGSPERFEIDKSLLQEGENVIAVQVHNVSSSSSDLSFIPFLSLGFSEEPDSTAETPDILNLTSLHHHTNFKIKSGGDDVYLSKNGIIVDSLIIPPLSANISFGRVENSPDSLVYFKEPTPGEKNSDNNYPGFSPEVIFNISGGIYSGSVNVTLSTENDAEIYYTTNGDEPTTGSKRYTSDISLSGSTVIKAKSYTEGYLPSETVVNTYIINKNFSLPVISISTDSLNLWDYNEGIYVLGPNAESAAPNYGANFWEDWEKPAHIEFFNPEGEREFSEGCGIRIYGGWTRSYAQKSLAVFFRGEYGASALEYQLFPNLPYDEYQSFVLRNSGNDWQYTMMRDGLMQNIAKNAADVDGLEFRPAIVYLNGEYWGIHNIREKVNEDYLARRYGIDPDRVDILENNANVVEGSAEDYSALIDYIENNPLSDPQAYQYVSDRIDINEFISYFILNIYFVNLDWPGNNIKYWKSWRENSKWRWFLYDTDFGFGLYNKDNYQYDMMNFVTTIYGPSHPNPPWSTFLLRKLLENEEFEGKFIDKVGDLCNSFFKQDYVIGLIDSLSQTIIDEIPAHSQKWNQFSYDRWVGEVEYLRTFAKNRVQNLRSNVSGFFNLGGTTRITINNDEPSNGVVKVNSLIIDEQQWDGLYFINRNVKLTAIPKTGYRFSHWNGDINSEQPEISVCPSVVSDIEAVFVPASGENNTIVINEINYNSSDEFDTEDWVELYNNSKYDVDLSGWKFKDSNPEHEFVIPEGTVLAPEGYIVLCRDLDAFSEFFPEIENAIGDFDFGLSGGGEEIYILNQINAIVDSVVYDDEYPWPTEPDGNGHSLELINPDKDNNLPESWDESVDHGTPGKVNSIFVTSVTDHDNAKPLEYKLYSNYPNPFNPSTLITFQVPAAGVVILKVYDVLGREVKNLLNKHLNPGRYEIKFNAENLSSGLYIYSIKAGSFYDSKKMLLLK